jgi:hypothetical protein
MLSMPPVKLGSDVPVHITTLLRDGKRPLQARDVHKRRK